MAIQPSPLLSPAFVCGNSSHPEVSVVNLTEDVQKLRQACLHREARTQIWHVIGVAAAVCGFALLLIGCCSGTLPFALAGLGLIMLGSLSASSAEKARLKYENLADALQNEKFIDFANREEIVLSLKNVSQVYELYTCP